MRLAVIAVCLACGIARADDAKAVEAELRAVLDGPHTVDGKGGWYDQLANVKLLGPSGMPITDRALLDHELVDCPLGEITWKLGTPAIGVDGKRGFAWFQAPVAAEIICMTGGFAPLTAHDNLRASGIFVVEKGTWKLVALALSRPLPDAVLFKTATTEPASAEPTLDDSAAAKGIATWFAKGGLARAKAPDAVASGTAPAEFAAGAGAARLAAAWDRLALKANAIEATTFARGGIAMIRAEVPLPVKKKAAPMTLYAIAVLDDKTWHWVSLQFTSELATPPKSVGSDTGGIECPHGKC